MCSNNFPATSDIWHPDVSQLTINGALGIVIVPPLTLMTARNMDATVAHWRSSSTCHNLSSCGYIELWDRSRLPDCDRANYRRSRVFGSRRSFLRQPPRRSPWVE